MRCRDTHAIDDRNNDDDDDDMNACRLFLLVDVSRCSSAAPVCTRGRCRMTQFHRSLRISRLVFQFTMSPEIKAHAVCYRSLRNWLEEGCVLIASECMTESAGAAVASARRPQSTLPRATCAPSGCQLIRMQSSFIV